MDIKERIKQASKTKILDISQMDLKEVPPEIFELSDLRELVLGGNSEIFDFPYMENARWGRYNYFKKIPPEIGKLRNLEKLDLSFNSLGELPLEIGELENLIEINLSLCGLSEFPECLLKLKKLQAIDLSSFPDWQSLAFSKGFSYMDFESRNLMFENFYLEELRVLWRQGNYRNKIREIPAAIVKMPGLKQLNLKHNPTSLIPPAVLDSGVDIQT